MRLKIGKRKSGWPNARWAKFLEQPARRPRPLCADSQSETLALTPSAVDAAFAAFERSMAHQQDAKATPPASDSPVSDPTVPSPQNLMSAGDRAASRPAGEKAPDFFPQNNEFIGRMRDQLRLLDHQRERISQLLESIENRLHCDTDARR